MHLHTYTARTASSACMLNHIQRCRRQLSYIHHQATSARGLAQAGFSLHTSQLLHILHPYVNQTSIRRQSDVTRLRRRHPDVTQTSPRRHPDSTQAPHIRHTTHMAPTNITTPYTRLTGPDPYAPNRRYTAPDRPRHRCGNPYTPIHTDGAATY